MQSTTQKTRKPSWLKKRLPTTPCFGRTKNFLDNRNLYTVCEEARCPNRWECFSKQTATFLIMGPYCTRNCKFCSVEKGSPIPLRNEEIEGIVEFVKKMGLNYVVVTSVTRDDLPDGGASHFATLVKRLKNKIPGIRVELLIPDFRGNLSALELVLKSNPDVLNHNIETVERLYEIIRPGADYQRSLNILKTSKELNPNIPTKSGIMVGLGETMDELVKTLNDLKNACVDIVTIGQYLRPTKHQIEVKKYYTPEEFEKLKEIGEKIGIKCVLSGVFVRSSYMANEVFNHIKQ